jgi:uncharacterized cupredoxin-like copper-binding protein
MKVLQILMVLAAILLAGCQPAAVTEITVTASDIVYDVERIEIAANQPVRLVLENNGALEHDFVISEIHANGVEEHSSGHDTHGEESVDADLHVSVAAGQSSTLDFTALEPGEYEYFCSVPGHKEAGMAGILIVK